MWKKRYLSYNHNDDIVNKVQNPNEEPAEKSPDVKVRYFGYIFYYRVQRYHFPESGGDFCRI